MTNFIPEVYLFNDFFKPKGNVEPQIILDGDRVYFMTIEETEFHEFVDIIEYDSVWNYIREVDLESDEAHKLIQSYVKAEKIYLPDKNCYLLRSLLKSTCDGVDVVQALRAMGYSTPNCKVIRNYMTGGLIIRSETETCPGNFEEFFLNVGR